MPGFEGMDADWLRVRSRQRQGRNAGVSPLRRQNAPPSVEMTLLFCGWGEEQVTAKATADPYGMTNKRTDNDKGFVG
jgi:hypothetical protein